LAAIFFRRGLPVDVVVAAGFVPRKKALDRLMKFCSERKRLLICQVKEDWFAFGPPASLAGISRRRRAGRKARQADPPGLFETAKAAAAPSTIIDCMK